MLVFPFISFVFGSELETELFHNGNIEKALHMEAKEPIDFALKYFLLRQFGNNSEEAVYNALAASETNDIVQLLTARANSQNGQLQLTPNVRVSILKTLGEQISSQFFENKYNFKELTSLESMDNRIDAQDVLKNLRGRDELITAKFFYYIESRIYLLKDVIEELKYLAGKKNKNAYFFLGQAYFTGSGVEKDIDKAFEYFWASRTGNKSAAFLGIGKILMQPEYKYIEGAINSFKLAKGDIQDAEADYCLHLLIEEANSLEFKDCESLKRSAISGYLPAVQKYTDYYIGQGLMESALFSLMSITQYSPIFIQYDDIAFNSFLKKDYRKACLIYLFLSEFSLPVAISNSIYLMENHTLFDNQDTILFKLYKMLSLTNPSFNKNLGDCYFYGKGVEQSYESAFYSYLASKRYNAEGAYCTAYMLESGLGTPKNLIEAKRIISKYLTKDSLYLVQIYSYIRINIKIILFYYKIHLAAVSTLLCLSGWKYGSLILRMINK